jgi:putative mRNA 3-end processing factor
VAGYNTEMTGFSEPLLTRSPAGLYCPKADLYLDPWRPVHRALITHAHSDHARPGSAHYLTHRISVPLLHQRLATTLDQVQAVEYGEVVSVRGVNFSFHPAGHVPGSAQILVESGGDRWVFSGDYKLEDDGLSAAFEPVRCNTFISECTFGLPIFQWQPQRVVFDEIHQWWRANSADGYSSILCAYSLGKAQRILANLDRSIGRVVLHSSVARICEALGLSLQGVDVWSSEASVSDPVLVIAPPAVLGSPWLKRFGQYRSGLASGWMAIRGIKRRRGIERGFVLSDHADFSGLKEAITLTGAEKIYLTHGYTAHFGRWLAERLPALAVHELEAQYQGELEE